jgi:putative hydrolase of the HAD superfamily
MASADEIDAVTVDALGTTLELVDPVPRLQAALAERGVERDVAAIARAFAAEAREYVPRSHEGRDRPSLARLRRECITVFLEDLGADIDSAGFVPAFMSALEFRLAPGAAEALGRLRAAGLALACVANWDYTLPEQLDRLGVRGHFDTVVTSAQAGAPKPGTAIFRIALSAVSAEPGRALHVGDDQADSDGARAAGLAYEPPPLAMLPARLGLGA